jgi:Tfp pilus assembly protein PilF
VLLAVVTAAAWRWASARPYVVVGWLWYVGTLVPVIGIVQVGLQPRADRFTYVPLIGIFMIVAWGLNDIVARWPSRRRAVIAAALAVTLLFAVAARRQTTYWKDGVALWTRSVAVTPPEQAAQARFELGAELLRQSRVQEAIPHLVEAVRVQPGFTGAHGSLGDAYQRDGRIADAQREYETTLRLDPTLPEIHNNLGSIYASAGRLDDALPHFLAAVRLKPDLETAQVNLGVVLTRLGRKDEAIAALSAALRMNPSNAQARYVLELLRKE